MKESSSSDLTALATYVDQFVYSSSNWLLLFALSSVFDARSFGGFALITVISFAVAGLTKTIYVDSLAVITESPKAPSNRLVLSMLWWIIPITAVAMAVTFLVFEDLTSTSFLVAVAASAPLTALHEVLRARFLLFRNPTLTLVVDVVWLAFVVVGVTSGDGVTVFVCWLVGLLLAIKVYFPEPRLVACHDVGPSWKALLSEGLAARLLPILSITALGALGAVEAVGTFRLAQTLVAPMYLSLAALTTLSYRHLRTNPESKLVVERRYIFALALFFVAYVVGISLPLLGRTPLTDALSSFSSAAGALTVFSLLVVRNFVSLAALSSKVILRATGNASKVASAEGFGGLLALVTVLAVARSAGGLAAALVLGTTVSAALIMMKGRRFRSENRIFEV